MRTGVALRRGNINFADYLLGIQGFFNESKISSFILIERYLIIEIERYMIRRYRQITIGIDREREVDIDR